MTTEAAQREFSALSVENLHFSWFAIPGKCQTTHVTGESVTAEIVVAVPRGR